MRRLFRKNKMVWVIIAIATIAILSFSYQCIFQKTCKIRKIEQVVRSEAIIQFPKGVVHAEVVDTPASRAQGLSGRAGLGEKEGMLFVFDHPGKYGFWMKDMLFPIDIIWINEEGVIVYVENSVSSDTYKQDPPQTFINQPDALYVLELKAGQAEALGAHLGTKVRIAQ